MLRDLAASMQARAFSAEASVQLRIRTNPRALRRPASGVDKEIFSSSPCNLLRSASRPPVLRGTPGAPQGVVASLCDLSLQQVSLIGEHGCLKAFQPRERLLRFPLCFREISNLQSDAREQQVGEHGLSWKSGTIEESRGRNASRRASKCRPSWKAISPGTDQ